MEPRELSRGIVNPSADDESRNLRDHYELIQHFQNIRDFSLFTYHWFKENECDILKDDRLHHTDRLSKGRQRNLAVCPKPRITSLIGGNYHFKYSDRDEMLRNLAKDIEEGSPMYWNQIAFDVEGEGTRLVVDIDSDGRVLDDTAVCKISKVLWQTLKEYYAKDFDEYPIDIFVAKCGPRIKKGKMCTGIHMICHVKVSFDQARQIIHGYKLRLAKEPGVNMTGLEVDAGIYKDNSHQVSIRMIYSQKIENCPLCNNKADRKMACSFCDARGLMATKKTYEPLCCINPKTGEDDPAYFSAKCPDFFELVKHYSLWPEPRDSGHEFIKPVGDPVYEAKGNEKTGKAQKPTGAGTKRMKKIKSSDPVYTMVEEFIHDILWNGKKLWARVDVDNISLTESQRMAWISISGLDSSMCPYAMRDHGGNRMYFTLSRGGQLTVKCRSEKGCKDKDKIVFDLPGPLTQQIFGIKGPGNVIRYANTKATDRKNLSFTEFSRRQSSDVFSPEKHRLEDQEVQKQKRLKYLTECYSLQKT